MIHGPKREDFDPNNWSFLILDADGEVIYGAHSGSLAMQVKEHLENQFPSRGPYEITQNTTSDES